MCDVKKFKMHIQQHIKRRLYFLLLEYGKKKILKYVVKPKVRTILKLSRYIYNIRFL